MSWAIKEVGLEPKTYRYASKRPDDALIRQRLKELVLERRRFGYRRLHIMLRREGIVLNCKKLYRLYREERLMVRKRGGTQTCTGNESADGNPARKEPTLVARLCVRCARLQPQVPYPGRGR